LSNTDIDAIDPEDAKLKEALEAEKEVFESFFASEDAEISVDMTSWDEGKGVTVHLELPIGPMPSPCNVLREDGTTCSVNYLPPVHIRAFLGQGYPETRPTFTIECPWLSLENLSLLCRNLDGVANENLGGYVLFQWAVYVHAEAGNAIHLRDPIVIEPLQRLRAADYAGLDVRACSSCFTPAEALALLEERDHAKRRRTFIAKHHSCGVCLQDVAGSRAVQLGACGHIFCRACISGLCHAQISDGSVQYVCCPSLDCRVNLLPSDVKPLVTQEMYERFEHFTLQRALEAMADLCWCPRCDGAVLKEDHDNLAQCAECHFSFCTLCRAGWHPGVCVRADNGTLKSVREQLTLLKSKGSLLTPKEQDKVRQLEQLVASIQSEQVIRASVVNGNAKSCPRCRTTIFKAGGCNKMTCRKCGAFFCWLCDREIQGYEHFQTGACAGQLFPRNQMQEDTEDGGEAELGLDLQGLHEED
jgi:E3 ubiquitin-protein ligase RNF14